MTKCSLYIGLTFVFIFSLFNEIFGQSDKFKMALISQNRQELNNLNEGQITRLEAKFMQLLTNAGIASLNIRNTIRFEPKLVLFNEQTVNPGVQTLYVINGELLLNVKSGDDAIFESKSFTLKGSGRTKEMAFNNLINEINPSNDKYRLFLENAKDKAGKYFEENCQNIITQARQLSDLNQMEEALSLLFSVPQQSECQKNTINLQNDIFRKYQERNCTIILQEAKALLASNKYEQGFSTLAQIDPLSPCAKDVLQIIEKDAREVDIERHNLRAWTYLNNVYFSRIAVAQYRSEAIYNLLLSRSSRSPYYR